MIVLARIFALSKTFKGNINPELWAAGYIAYFFSMTFLVVSGMIASRSLLVALAVFFATYFGSLKYFSSQKAKQSLLEINSSLTTSTKIIFDIFLVAIFLGLFVLFIKISAFAKA